MKFDPPLVRGILVRRYKRFLADVVLPDGQEITAHCPNPGSMKTCAEPGWVAWVSPANNPKRKLKWTLEIVESPRTPILVNTSRPNHIVHSAIQSGHVPELAGYSTLRTEVRYGENSRIDVLCSAPSRPACYVEVKNVTYLYSQGVAAFPDGVSKRAAKHMVELASMVEQGHRAVVLFLVSRTDVDCMKPADHIDAKYGIALRAAVSAGVEALAYRLEFTATGVELGPRIAIDLQQT